MWSIAHLLSALFSGGTCLVVLEDFLALLLQVHGGVGHVDQGFPNTGTRRHIDNFILDGSKTRFQQCRLGIDDHTEFAFCGFAQTVSCIEETDHADCGTCTDRQENHERRYQK